MGNQINTKRRKIVVVDDHPLLRQGLAQLIDHEEDLVFSGEAGNPVDAMKVIQKVNPDLIIVDISMQGLNGIDLIKSVLTDFPKMPILVISMHDENLYAERVLRAGARGYLMKQEAIQYVVSAIRKVLNGEVYLSDALKEQLLTKLVRGPSTNDSPLESLTDRELEVAHLIAQGKGTRQIAEKLHLSVKTIESHYANIKIKLGIRTSPELIQYAVKNFPNES